MRKGKCKCCGRTVRWIKTPAGSYMPVDMGGRAYWPRPGAKGRIVTADGVVLACDFEGDKFTARYGYVPHFATCRGKRAPRAKRESTRAAA